MAEFSSVPHSFSRLGLEQRLTIVSEDERLIPNCALEEHFTNTFRHELTRADLNRSLEHRVQNGGCVLTVARPCHGHYSLQTGGSSGHSPQGAVLINGAPPSLIYSSAGCDLALALPATVETPRGHIHYYLESRWAEASDRTHAAPIRLVHTGPALEGR